MGATGHAPQLPEWNMLTPQLHKKEFWSVWGGGGGGWRVARKTKQLKSSKTGLKKGDSWFYENYEGKDF